MLLFGSILLASSCEKTNEPDKEKPSIDIDFAEAFPINCDTLYFGETFNFIVKFTDNVELGSYSIDIHNNFDHHSHSTEVTECSLDPIKEPINPYTFIQDYDIPSGSSEYETHLSLTIPSEDESGQAYDDGDYHFFISLTDKEGWSTQKGLSLKILRQ